MTETCREHQRATRKTSLARFFIVVEKRYGTKDKEVNLAGRYVTLEVNISPNGSKNPFEGKCAWHKAKRPHRWSLR